MLKVWFEEPDGWLDQRIRDHQEILHHMVSLIGKADGARVRPTEGGSYLFPELPPLSISVLELCDLLRTKYGVIVTPGTEFGPQFRSNIRLNFSQDRQRAIEAGEIIAQFVQDHVR